MALLLDANLWIDFTRTRSPRALKAFIAPYILDTQACLAEPVVFEVLRSATDAEARQLSAHFETLPLLASPPDLWSRGIALGQACRRKGVNAMLSWCKRKMALSTLSEMLHPRRRTRSLGKAALSTLWLGHPQSRLSASRISKTRR